VTTPFLRIIPAIPTLVPEPFHRPGWVFEEEVDGWRIIAYRNGTDVRLISRTGRDHTARFPDVARALAKLSPHTLILDGEVAVFDVPDRRRGPRRGVRGLLGDRA
jgi:bifunctional non-homologous end joining protein LigD